MSAENDPVPAQEARVHAVEGQPGREERDRPALPAAPAKDPSVDRKMEQNQAGRRQLLVGGSVLLLAFVLAAFPARNTDLWLHLATGRALVEGTYHFGVDPFAYTTQDVYWVNHAWLFDLIVYGVYRALGGAGLVFLKALLLAGLAAVLLRVANFRGSRAVAAMTVSLALVALGSRLQLQPVVVSYLFLALTLLSLQRIEASLANTDSDTTHRSPLTTHHHVKHISRNGWPLLLLFALWVNLDSWFLLGPLAVALDGLGRWLDSTRLFGPRADGSATGGTADRSSKVWFLPFAGLVLAGLAVCLLNPHGFRAFLLPPQLGLGSNAAALQQDPLFRGLRVSPFQGLYFRSGLAFTFSSLAYYALVGLGGVSFMLSRTWPGRRLLLFLGFFLLSGYQVRAIPFFAVVAGPVLALNWQGAKKGVGSFGTSALASLLRGRKLPTPFFEQAAAHRFRWAEGVIALAVLALAVVAFPGWLQGKPYVPRGFEAAVDPSLERSASQLAAWRREGKLAARKNGLNLSPEAASYFAWACPEEKGFLDHRLELFGDVAGEYAAMRAALMNLPVEGPGAEKPDEQALAGQAALRQTLRRRDIDHLVLYDPDLPWKASPVDRLLTAPVEWRLLYLDGRTLIFAWQESQDFAARGLDLDRLAVQPAGEESGARGQGSGVSRPGRRPGGDFWSRTADFLSEGFVTPPAPRPLATDAAAIYLRCFDDRLPGQRNRNLLVWAARVGASFAGTAATASTGGHGLAPLAAYLDYRARVDRTDQFLFNQDDGSPALALLAIRAARQGVRDNPDEALTYVVLGEAYLRLDRNTRERAWKNRLPSLSQLRRVQAMAAFQQALALQPSLGRAHANLTSLCEEIGGRDLALAHLRSYVQIARGAGPNPSETAEFAQRLDEMEKRLDAVDRQVTRAIDDYEIEAFKLKPVERAQRAYARGLAGKALDVLKSADLGTLGPEGIRLLMALLLDTGQIDELSNWITPESEDYWLKALVAAAGGAYDDADAELAALSRSSVVLAEGPVRLPLQAALGVMVGRAVLEGAAPFGSLADGLRIPILRTEYLKQAQNLVLLLRREADLAVLRALLELESGKTTEAQAHLRDVLEQWPGGSPDLDFAARPAAEHYLHLFSH
jgi:hypothetical protein